MRSTIVAISAVLLSSLPAFGLDVCVTRGGRIRAPHPTHGCPPYAQTVALVTASERAAAPTADVPNAAAKDIQVVDADGRQAGVVLSTTWNATLTVREIDGRAVALPLGPNGLVATSSAYAYFTTADCTGSPRVLENSGSLIVFPPVVAGSAYVQSGAAVQDTARSYLVDTTDCGEFGGVAQGTACCVSQPAGGLFAPATAMNAAAIGIVPPLRIEVR